MVEGNVIRIINGGYDSIPKIIAMKIEDYIKIDGFKETRINNFIKVIVKNIVGKIIHNKIIISTLQLKKIQIFHLI